MKEPVEKLRQHMARSLDLGYSAAVLSWDQEVYMPEAGSEARSEQLATLHTIAHDILVSDETRRLLESSESAVIADDFGSDDASLVRIARREFDRATKIPAAFVAEESRTTSLAFVAWKGARERKDFQEFRPHLERIVDLSRRKADYLGYRDQPYDALLQLYEPGMMTFKVEEIFRELRDGLVPLLRDVAARKQEKKNPFTTPYDTSKQWEFTMRLLKDMGFDFNRGRQDLAPHPFTTTFSVKDVRVTTRLHADLPQSAIFSSVHEGGHALYEQGIPEKFDRTVLGQGATLGLHESQSRLWENQVARSLPFWKHYLPLLREFFPEQLKNISAEEFYRAVNRVEPGFIRVEADELTYNLHIFVRFELEKALVNGDLQAADVPAAWNEKYREYLGITPPDDGLGCLQDIHWSHGSIGYFPTYTLGNLIAAQLFERIQKEIPDIESDFAAGKFQRLLAWLRKNVHEHGAKFTAPELLERILGEEILAGPMLNAMRKKYTELFEL